MTRLEPLGTTAFREVRSTGTECTAIQQNMHPGCVTVLYHHSGSPEMRLLSMAGERLMQ
jgi:hypothetical protein